jgi:hypothetical protein
MNDNKKLSDLMIEIKESYNDTFNVLEGQTNKRNRISN